MDGKDRKPAGFASKAAVVVASFFYVGYAPVASGTFGSLAAFALYFPLLHFTFWPVYLGVTVFCTLIGVWAAGRCEKDSGIVDPSYVVMDEVAGQLITLFLIPFSWKIAAIGFVLFRIMDIVKPFPANRAEHLPGGWGIMLDDVIAGVYGNLILRLLLFLMNQILHIQL